MHFAILPPAPIRRLARQLTRGLWAAYETLAMGLGWGTFALLCLFALPLVWVLSILPSRAWVRRMARTTIHRVFHFYLEILRFFCSNRFDLSELDALKTAPAQVLIANHPSLMDVVLIVSRLPNVVCIMKAGLMNNILLGAAARAAGYIRNDNPRTMLFQAHAALKEGAHVLIFPEGGRTRHFPLDPFGKSAALIAKQAGAPIQTVFITCSTPYLGKHWPLWRRPALPLRWAVHAGARFDSPTHISQCTQMLEASVRAQLAPLYANSQPNPPLGVEPRPPS